MAVLPGSKNSACLMQHPFKGKSLTKEQALQKLRHYCGYQERCHQDVIDKLFKLGVKKKDHDEIIASLVEGKYLDEERFAIAFAGGKFRMNQWGRIKIKYELKQRRVSDYSIRKALKQITEKDYLAVLQKIAGDRYDSLKEEEHLVRKKKTMDYLIQKGFEAELIKTVLDKRL